MKTYFIQAVDGGPIKIGISRDPESRLKIMQTGNPKRLRILAVLNGDMEGELHCLFSSHRVTGEWFSPAGELVAWLNDNVALTTSVRQESGDPIPFRIFVKNYRPDEIKCEIVFERSRFEDDLDFAEALLNQSPFAGCYLSSDEYLESAEEEDGDLGEPSEDDCCCDSCLWNGAIDALASETMIDRIGIDHDGAAIYITCKPINSHDREQRLFALGGLAADLDCIGWDLVGLFCYPDKTPPEWQETSMISFWFHRLHSSRCNDQGCIESRHGKYFHSTTESGSEPVAQ